MEENLDLILNLQQISSQQFIDLETLFPENLKDLSEFSNKVDFLKKNCDKILKNTTKLLKNLCDLQNEANDILIPDKTQWQNWSPKHLVSYVFPENFVSIAVLGLLETFLSVRKSI